jgi:hypothetical protein
MLTLTFQFGDQRRGLSHDRIVEVVALVDLTPVGPSPPGVVGAFGYHGVWVPALDLSLLSAGHPAARRWSTRILIVDPRPAGFPGPLLGLIAEEATEMILRPSGPDSERESGGTVPELRWKELLTPELHDWLAGFVEPTAPADTSTPSRIRSPRNPRRPRHYHPET